VPMLCIDEARVVGRCQVLGARTLRDVIEALTGVAPFDGDNVNAIMYATVNTTPPPPSQHNRAVPPMLDLIVAKAMAKLLEDRYQSIKEFGDDLREVRRQMDSSRPAAALKAMTAPPSRPPAPKPLVESDTIPIVDAKAEEDAKPLSLAKTFDSFDATMRLMAQTGEIDEFKDYITQTQKMRAYKGKIESTSPLAKMATPEPTPEPKPAPPPEKKAAPPPEKKAAPRPVVVAQPAADGLAISSNTSNLIMISAIVVLVLAAIGLLVALVIR